MIRALIFDFDGTILDTEVPEYRAWCEIYDEHGCALPLASWTETIGKSGADVTFSPYDELERQLGRPIERERIRAVKRRRFAELVEAQPVCPGIAECLAAARVRGMKLAVASSSDRAWVEGHLARRDLLAYFDCLRCADDVRRTKPDPELYLSALAALGVEPDEAVAIEDSPNGVLAAKRAGLFCVAVPNALTCGLPLEHADRRLETLAAVALDHLLPTRDEGARGGAAHGL